MGVEETTYLMQGVYFKENPLTPSTMERLFDNSEEIAIHTNPDFTSVVLGKVLATVSGFGNDTGMIDSGEYGMREITPLSSMEKMKIAKEIREKTGIRVQLKDIKTLLFIQWT